MPYLLLPMSRRAILELLSGELSLTVLVNPGHVCDALRDRGLEVELRPQLGGPGEIVVHATSTSKDGVPLNMEAHVVDWYLRETVQEFRTLEHLVEMSANAVNGMTLHVPKMTPPWLAGDDEEAS